MRTVEGSVYTPPEGFGTLSRSWSLRDDITKPGNFNDLPQMAEELGFQVVKVLPTRRQHQWRVYDRPNHDVLNFPEGSTRINSTLALYNTDFMTFTHAILRTSREPIPMGEFETDLDTFTRNYIERPHILGFPSRWLNSLTGTLGGAAAGAVLLSAADYYTVQSIPGSIVNVGSIVGGVSGGMVGFALAWLPEEYARKKIPNLGQYSSGGQVKNELSGERYHEVQVIIQKELYSSLKEEGVELSPDQFLGKIYGQIPSALIIRRHAEVEQAKYPKLDSPREIGNSLPQLIQVSHVLQQIEAYLNAANELKRGLAQ